MLLPHCNIWMISIVAMVLGAGGACGQDYPSKPIRIVTSEPGGNGDFNARLIAQGLTGALGESVIVENRGGQILSSQTVANAAPDGYTLLGNGSGFWIAALLKKLPYDPVKDFSPVTTTTISPSVLVVHPSVPVRSVKELIALAKARPGELSYAAGSLGAPSHLAGELFKVMAGVKIVAIPYKSAGASLNDLIGGQVQLMFATATSVAPHLKSFRLRALAVASAQPSALLPGLPTVAASGVPGYESISIQGIWAPAKTPAAIINRLNQEIVRFLNKAEVKEKLLNIGIEAGPNSPEDLAAIMKSEMVRLGKVIKEAGIRAE